MPLCCMHTTPSPPVAARQPTGRRAYWPTDSCAFRLGAVASRCSKAQHNYIAVLHPVSYMLLTVPCVPLYTLDCVIHCKDKFWPSRQCPYWFHACMQYICSYPSHLAVLQPPQACHCCSTPAAAHPKDVMRGDRHHQSGCCRLGPTCQPGRSVWCTAAAQQPQALPSLGC